MSGSASARLNALADAYLDGWSRARLEPGGCPRADAEGALGTGFDVRRFHAAVPEDGSVTLPMLRDRLARWTAAEAG